MGMCQERPLQQRHQLHPSTLMELAKNKFSSLVEDNTWKQQTPEEKQIVAMTAEIKALKKAAKRNSKKDDKDDGLDKKKTKKKSNKKDDAWFFKNPDNKKTMTCNGKDYNWCPYHGENGKWVCHALEQCEIFLKKQAEKKKGEDDPKVKLKVAALQSLVEEDEDF